MPDSPPRRRWFRLGIRGLMGLILVVGGGLGGMMHQIRVDRATQAAIEAADASLDDARDDARPDDPWTTRARRWVWGWIAAGVGDDFLAAEVTGFRVYSPITTGMFAHLARFQHLEELTLKEVTGPDADWHALAGLPDLRAIDLLTPVGDPVLRAVGQIRPLRRLRMVWDQKPAPTATDAGFAALVALPDLAKLEIAEATGLTDAGAARLLAGLPRLRSLMLANAPGEMTVTITALVRHHPVLDELELDGSHVTDADLAILGGLKQLKTLSLNRTDVTDAGLAHLQRIPGLKELYLGTPGVTDGGLSVLGELANLDFLHLEGARITDAGLPSLSRLTLKTLVLDGTGVTSAGMASVAGLARLEVLSLNKLPALTDAGLIPLRRLTHLVFLTHDGTPVTREGVAALKAALPRLGSWPF